jgi:molybdenum cofactor biosynthesis protein B
VEAVVTAEDLPADAVARVVTVSDRSHGGLRHDESGPLLAGLLRELGFATAEVVVVPDEVPQIEAVLRAAVADGIDLVATTGGTGFAVRDVTPEATRKVIEREAPGLGEALRQYNRDKVPTTILSRAVAGIAGGTIVVNLPGSTGGVRDGVSVLAPVIGHAITQLRGGDH